MSPTQNPNNVYIPTGYINREAHETLMGQKGACVWLTGLSASGKTSIARALQHLLHERHIKTYALDGDIVRSGLCKDLPFTSEGRAENIRRVGEVSKLFVDGGVIVLSSFISPYLVDRQIVRELHEADNMPFIEVFVDCSLEAAEERDPKGLYKKARAGEIKNFTGIDDPYEAPEAPEVHLHTDQQSLEEEVEHLIALLEKQGLIPAAA